MLILLQRRNLEIALENSNAECSDLRLRLSGAEGRVNALEAQLARVEGAKRDAEFKLSSIHSSLRRTIGFNQRARSPSPRPRSRTPSPRRRPLSPSKGEVEAPPICSAVARCRLRQHVRHDDGGPRLAHPAHRLARALPLALPRHLALALRRRQLQRGGHRPRGGARGAARLLHADGGRRA